jgi:RHS repeat-associated protein
MALLFVGKLLPFFSSIERKNQFKIVSLPLQNMGCKKLDISKNYESVLTVVGKYPTIENLRVGNFLATKKGCVNYFPFGSVMPGRNFNQTEYSYGWQGQLKVDEIAGAGNHYTAEFWEYNPRVVMRWNQDPVKKAWISPYAVLGNNPILFVDPNGDDWFKNGAGEEKWHEATGNKGDEVSLKGLEGTWTNIGAEFQRAYSLGSTAGLYTEYYGKDGSISVYDYPMWVEQGKEQIGLKEGGNATIQGMIDNMNANFGYADKTEKPIKNDSEPWCGVFVYDCLTGAGESVTQKPKTWQTPALNTFYSNNWAEGTVLTNPTYGAIAVMSYGHVAMVVGYDDTYVWILGGNQPANGAVVRDGTEVNITRYKRSLVSKYVIPAGYNSPPLGTFDE